MIFELYVGDLANYIATWSKLQLLRSSQLLKPIACISRKKPLMAHDRLKLWVLLVWHLSHSSDNREWMAVVIKYISKLWSYVNNHLGDINLFLFIMLKQCWEYVYNPYPYYTLIIKCSTALFIPFNAQGLLQEWPQ